MFLGLPLRTTRETTDPNGMPLVASAFQSLATLLALTRRVISGSTEKLTMSAGLPSTTARDWSPEAPYEVVTATPLPSSVAANAGMILLQPGSGTAYATRVRVVSAAGCWLPPATSLDPPPQPATRVAVAARAAP